MIVPFSFDKGKGLMLLSLVRSGEGVGYSLFQRGGAR